MQGVSNIDRDLVLIGGGHSHLAVIKQLAMDPVPGLRISVVSRDIHTPYSGMLPGLIAGHYGEDECFIDLRRLCQWAGFRLFHASATGIDSRSQQVFCDNRPPLRYDWLSINTGSTPNISAIAGARDHGVPVKPIDHFIAALEQWLDGPARKTGRRVLTVVGGGAASVEVILAIQYRIEGLRTSAGVEYQLVSAADRLLPGHNRRVMDYFTRVMKSRGIPVKLQHQVESLGDQQLYCLGVAPLHSDFTVLATQAASPAWLKDSEIALDDEGFVAVSDGLQSLSDSRIFAAGDCAGIESLSLPKSGVYAVRQGPILAENIRRSIAELPLRRYRPQRRFLSLLATGDQRAVASRGWWFAAGPWVWRWKSAIDRRFMARFNHLPPMAKPEEEAEESMRCGGCGAKVAGQALQLVLQRLARDTEQTEPLPTEDAALITPAVGQQLVQTIDHFRAFIDDPYLTGRIGANHCLGDIYAMGATPVSALALANIPFGHPKIVEDTLYQLMRGAAETLKAANVSLLGGHSAEAAELAFGLTVNGQLTPGTALFKSGLKIGEALILTKPLGTGTLLAANMRHAARGRWVEAALSSMQQSNAGAAAIMRSYRASACTDITGFGLLGHLLEMLRASGVGASLSLKALPTLPGALDCLDQGIFSTLHPDNARYSHALTTVGTLSESPLVQLLYDPQTAGGLLFGVASAQAGECVTALREANYEAAIVGRVHSGEDGIAVALEK